MSGKPSHCNNAPTLVTYAHCTSACTMQWSSPLPCLHRILRKAAHAVAIRSALLAKQPPRNQSMLPVTDPPPGPRRLTYETARDTIATQALQCQHCTGTLFPRHVESAYLQNTEAPRCQEKHPLSRHSAPPLANSNVFPRSLYESQAPRGRIYRTHSHSPRLVEPRLAGAASVRGSSKQPIASPTPRKTCS